MFLVKRRISFFSRIFFFSIFIIFVTLSLSYISNAIFLDKFYIYRKKQLMLSSMEKIKEISERKDRTELEKYIYDMRELEGIDLSVNKKMSSGMMGSHSMIINSNIPENQFIIKELPSVGALILSYSERLSDGRKVVATTSLSVMNAHKHETDVFNIVILFTVMLISVGAAAFFSKRITKDIKELNETANRIAQLKFPENIALERDDEIGDLSRNIEKMSQNLSLSMNKLKSFVSNASHELKTPISVICSYAYSLSRGQLTSEEEKKHYYDVILKKGLEMKEITESLLSLSKLDAMNYPLQEKIIDLKEMIKESIEKYDFLEFEKDLEVILSLSPLKIKGDPLLFKLILDNIIQNAFKYSPEKETVDISYFEGKLYFSNKTFCTEEKTDELIQPFKRGKNSENFGIEGTGLGLSIVEKSLKLSDIPFQILWLENTFKFIIDINEKIIG